MGTLDLKEKKDDKKLLISNHLISSAVENWNIYISDKKSTFYCLYPKPWNFTYIYIANFQSLEKKF